DEWRGTLAIDNSFAVDEIAPDGIAFRRGATGFVEVGQHGAEFGVLVEEMRGGEHLGLHGVVDHVLPDIRGIDAAVVYANGGIAGDEDVVVDAVVTASPDEGAVLQLVENVAFDGNSGGTVIEIDSHGTEADAAEVVNVVMANDGAALRVVAA